jgi:hypothetical protein
MKPIEIVLRRERGAVGRTMDGVNLTKIYCKHIVNITIYNPVQLLHANKIF